LLEKQKEKEKEHLAREDEVRDWMIITMDKDKDLSERKEPFPYLLYLTLMHMVFSSILCFIIIKALKLVKLQDGMTPGIYVSTVPSTN